MDHFSVGLPPPDKDSGLQAVFRHIANGDAMRMFSGKIQRPRAGLWGATFQADQANSAMAQRYVLRLRRSLAAAFLKLLGGYENSEVYGVR